METRASARSAKCSRRDARSPVRDVLVVWALYAAVGVAILVTYARLPVRELYHVSRSGLAGGAGRLLVFSNFPVALVAIAVGAACTDRLLASGRNRRAVLAAGACCTLLCAVVAAPSVVDERDLDAKWINAVPALGVVLALALTAAAARTGLGHRRRLPGDRLRMAAVALLLVGSLPWLAAELGFYLDGPFLGSEIPPGQALPAVHHGHHHGLDGVLLALTAIVLSRALADMRTRALQLAVSAFLALMLSYGLANGAQDFWLEQVVKRGWTAWELPTLLHPALTPGWGALVAAGVALELAWLRLAGRPRSEPPRRR